VTVRRTIRIVVVLWLTCAGCSGFDLERDRGHGVTDAPAPVAASTSQTPAEMAAEAANVAWLLEHSGATAIVCHAAPAPAAEGQDARAPSPGAEIRIARGSTGVDETGLVMSGDYSYGTDEIREIFGRGSLLIEWGEEGNYHLVVPNYAWLLFGYDGTDVAPSIDDEGDDILGSVFSEQETVEQVGCRLERPSAG